MNKFVRIPVFSGAILVASFVTAANALPTYDAALGTLPDAQGFQRNESPSYPAPSLVDGALHQFADSSPTTIQYWRGPNIPVNFALEPFAIEAEVRIFSSNYVTSGLCCNSQRSGFYLGVSDTEGRRALLGIAARGLTVNTDVALSKSNGLVLTNFDSTTGFHKYRLSFSSDAVALTVDGQLINSTELGATGVDGEGAYISFGDASGPGIAEFEVRHVAVVPEPSAAALMFAGLSLVFLLTRRVFGIKPD